MPVCPSGHDSSAADFCDTCGMRIEGAPGSASGAGGSGTGASGTGGSGAGSDAGGGSGARGGHAEAAAGGTAGQAMPAEQCPQCGTERSGQFCEGCGYDFRSGAPARTAAPPVIAVGREPETATGLGDPAAVGTPGSAAGPGVTSAGPGVPAGAAAPPASGPAWTAVVTADRGYFDRVVAAGGPDAASIEFPAYCPERRFPLAGKEVRVGRRSVSRGLEPEIDLTGPPTDPGISHLHAVLVAQPPGTWSVLDPGSSNGTQVNGADIEVGVAVPLRPGDQVCIGAWTALTIQP